MSDVTDINEIKNDVKEIKGKINNLIANSDGYHTFEELYEQRAVLFAIICNQNRNFAWKSYKHYDGTMYDNMFIVGMSLPGEGEVTYHVEDDYDYLFENIKEIPNAPEYDGYTSDDVLARLYHFFINNDTY